MGFLKMLSKEELDHARKRTKGFIPQRNHVASNTIPEGTYECKLVDVVPNEKENGYWLTSMFEITSGNYAGRTLPKAVNIDDCERLSWFFNELSRFGYDQLLPDPDQAPATFDPLVVLDAVLDDLQGKPVLINHTRKVKGGVVYWNNYFQNLVEQPATTAKKKK
jgi:hypothetical protein